jgi:[ribosomal protein S18]-alanine N-acetyltransferase
MSGKNSPVMLIESDSFVIDSMTEHDLLEVVEIEEASGLSRWGFEAYHEELIYGQNALMFVARRIGQRVFENEKGIYGFIASRLVTDELHINNVAVRSESRRSGIGCALLLMVINEAAQKGAQKAFLEVRASNAAAQALYARCGFRIMGLRKGYYSDPSEDALIMSRTI